MAVRHQVKFYYDVLCPFAWYGFELLSRYEKPWNLALQLKPMSLGKVVDASGNRSPTLNASKASMLSQDTQRVGDMMDLPYTPPKDIAETLFVRGSVTALKILAACQINYPDFLPELSRQMWLGIYSDDIDINDEANIRKFAEAAGVPDIDALIEFSKGPEARQQLIDNTTAALDSQCFGAPWYTTIHPVSGRQEKFFGHDRVEMLGWVLGKKYVGHHPPAIIE